MIFLYDIVYLECLADKNAILSHKLSKFIVECLNTENTISISYIGYSLDFNLGIVSPRFTSVLVFYKISENYDLDH